MSAITNRILTQLGDNELIEKLQALPKSDLTSLLLSVFREQANNTAPVDVVKAFRTNRFSTPSEIDPAAYHAYEADLLSLAKETGIEAILLSPCAPFASCSAFGCVDQNNIVSAVRGTEILSDPTNMLAIIIAGQLTGKKADNRIPLHYCTTARVLRAQVFPALRGYYSHFGIFCIVSSGKDSGSYSCEKELFVKHLAYYKKLLFDKYGSELSVMIRKSRGYTDSDGFYGSMIELVRSGLPDVPVSVDPEYEENNYYRGIHFKLYMEKGIETIEIGDGGFVDWIEKMTNVRKERCLISGIGIDRLLIDYS